MNPSHSTNDIFIKSWEELQGALFRETWNEGLQRHRSNFVYRGLSDKAYELKSTLTRMGGDFSGLERHLLRNFRKYAHKISESEKPYWHWLAIAQHYGLPTRLLDWTYSPYVALHFATASLAKFKEDGVIWAVNYTKVKELLPERLGHALREEGGNVFTTDLLGVACANLTEFDQLQEREFTLFLEPPSLDDRIVQQHALFSLMNSPQRLMDEWLREQPDIYFRIIIPSELKWEIRDKLDQANITERVLFPGLNGLSRWLHRHYSPRGGEMGEEGMLF